MSENAVKLFAAFMTETPDYDPNHIEHYIQWLADKIDDLTDQLEAVEGIKQTALTTIKLAREAADLRVEAMRNENTKLRNALERFAKIDLTGPIGNEIAWDILNARAVLGEG